MCSMKWATPVSSADSRREPARTYAAMETERAPGTRELITRGPEGSAVRSNIAADGTGTSSNGRARPPARGRRCRTSWRPDPWGRGAVHVAGFGSDVEDDPQPGDREVQRERDGGEPHQWPNLGCPSAHGLEEHIRDETGGDAVGDGVREWHDDQCREHREDVVDVAPLDVLDVAEHQVAHHNEGGRGGL